MRDVFSFAMLKIIYLLTFIFSILEVFLPQPTSADFPQNTKNQYKNSELPKVALILTGGAARGLCHIGVIKVLEENNIPIDMIIGISMGSIVGGYYAYGYTVEHMLEKARQFSLLSLIDLNYLSRGFLSGEKLQHNIFERDVDFARIEELGKPLYILSTDLITGSVYIFDHGPLSVAMRASSAIPGVFDPVVYNGRILVDGGILTSIPVFLAKEKGADIIIVSNVSVSRNMQRSKMANRLYRFALEYVERNRKKLEEKTRMKEQNILEVIFRTLLLIENNQGIGEGYDESLVDFTIEPVGNEIKPFDFYKVDEGYKLGREATEKIIDRIKERVCCRTGISGTERR